MGAAASGAWAVGPVPTLLEWDTNIPDLDRVLDEADRAREIWREVAGAEPVGDGAEVAEISA